MANVCKDSQGNAPMKLYVLHGYADGLTDPIVSIDYEEVYAAMKTAYESALNGVEQEDSDRGYSFLEGWSTGWNGRLRNWSYKFQMNRKNILRKWTIFLAKSNDFEPPSRTALFHVPGSNLYPTPQTVWIYSLSVQLFSFCLILLIIHMTFA